MLLHAIHPDALAPYRASIRRVMRERRCSPTMAAIICAAKCGKKHEEILERLEMALEQVKASINPAKAT